MIIGMLRQDWIERLGYKKADKFLELVDAIVVVGSIKSDERPYYFVNESYDKIKRILTEFSNLKAYPQRTWWTTNYSLVEIEDGVTPEMLRKRWVDELRARNLV